MGKEKKTTMTTTTATSTRAASKWSNSYTWTRSRTIPMKTLNERKYEFIKSSTSEILVEWYTEHVVDNVIALFVDHQEKQPNESQLKQNISAADNTHQCKQPNRSSIINYYVLERIFRFRTITNHSTGLIEMKVKSKSSKDAIKTYFVIKNNSNNKKHRTFVQRKTVSSRSVHIHRIENINFFFSIMRMRLNKPKHRNLRYIIYSVVLRCVALCCVLTLVGLAHFHGKMRECESKPAKANQSKAK